MKKSTMVALGCGAGAVACIALAVHLRKRRQTGAAVACGVVGGCAAVVAAGAAVRSAGEKKKIPQEVRELHMRAGGSPVDYDAIELYDRLPTVAEVRAAAASINFDMSGYTDDEIQSVINIVSALSLPNGKIYMPQNQTVHGRVSQQQINALLAHEVEHQAQYQNNDARQIFGRLVQEAQMDRSVIDPYKTPDCLEYEAQLIEDNAEDAYLQGWRPSSAVLNAN